MSTVTMPFTDLSSLPKLGVKGPGAEAWLRDCGVEVPPATYDVRPLSDGGLIARLGNADFFLESAGDSDLLSRLAVDLAGNPSRVYRVERHDACFVLNGPTALDVLAQVCSFDFRSAPLGRVVLTRAAGINCMVLPHGSSEHRQFRVWVDCSFAAYFAHALGEIGDAKMASVEA